MCRASTSLFSRMITSLFGRTKASLLRWLKRGAHHRACRRRGTPVHQSYLSNLFLNETRIEENLFLGPPRRARTAMRGKKLAWPRLAKVDGLAAS
jgi:hypothetical protein